MKKKNTVDALTGAMIVGIFGALCVYMALSGEVRDYVHPRYQVFVGLAGGLMLLCAAGLVPAAVKGVGHMLLRGLAGMVLIAAPFVLTAAVSGVAGDYLEGYQSFPDSFSAGAGNDSARNDDDGERIVFADETFYATIEKIYSNPGQYQGREVIVSGKLLQRQLADNSTEFAISRMLMVCCVADLQPVGFVCRYKDAASLRRHGWYTVEGRLALVGKDDSVIPVLDVVKVYPADKPVQKYVYPY